jgi:hypothetical protein
MRRAKRKSWKETYSTANIPEDAEERRRWYAAQWESAPFKLTLYTTGGNWYRLPFATKGEAEKKMKSAGADVYKADLNGVLYQRTKNYGWSKKA